MFHSLLSIRWRRTDNPILNGCRLAYIEIMAKANKSTTQEPTDNELFYLPVEGVTIEASSLEEARALAAELGKAKKDEEVGDGA